VIVGITGTCPYGIGACWGGAYEALQRLQLVHLVNPVPDTENSTATVFLDDERLPPVPQWRQEFQRVVNGTYEMRGVEVTLEGAIVARDRNLFLSGYGGGPPVQLVPLSSDEKVQWNHVMQQRKPLEENEVVAFQRLETLWKGLGDTRQVSVSGPLKLVGQQYQLSVRLFQWIEIR